MVGTVVEVRAGAAALEAAGRAAASGETSAAAAMLGVGARDMVAWVAAAMAVAAVVVEVLAAEVLAAEVLASSAHPVAVSPAW